MKGLIAEATIDRVAEDKATLDILCRRFIALEKKHEALEQRVDTQEEAFQRLKDHVRKTR